MIETIILMEAEVREDQNVSPEQQSAPPQYALAEPESVEFLDQVAEIAGIDRERALGATGVVLCTLFLGTDEDVPRDLQARLPEGLGQVLDRCPQIRGDSQAISGPTTLVHAVAERMQISEMEAQTYAHAVLEVTERVAGPELRRILRGFEPE